MRNSDQSILSFWTISRMQRLELLNHNHIHKQFKLIDIINQQKVKERDKQLQEQKLQQVVTPI